MNTSNSSDVGSLIVALGMVAGLFALIGAVRGERTKIGPFSPRRAMTNSSRLSSSNGASVLAVVELGQLASRDAASGLTAGGALPSTVTGLLVVALVLLGVAAIGTRTRAGQTVLTLIGIGLGLANSYLSDGSPGLLITLAIVLMALWLLGLVRGFTRVL